MEKPVLEVCTGSLQSVTNAVEGGAKRVELCSALSLDGLTPSLGLVQMVRDLYPSLKIHILIRVREGNFVYTEQEIRTMERDIEAVLPYCDAIVCGALTADGNIDKMATIRFLNACKGKPFTFHRAFDQCANVLQALDDLIALGCTRVLTSGQSLTAEKGISSLKTYIEYVEGRIIILPGGGVTPQNACRILAETGAKELHGSASSISHSGICETQSIIVRELIDKMRREVK